MLHLNVCHLQHPILACNNQFLRFAPKYLHRRFLLHSEAPVLRGLSYFPTYGQCLNQIFIRWLKFFIPCNGKSDIAANSIFLLSRTEDFRRGFVMTSLTPLASRITFMQWKNIMDNILTVIDKKLKKQQQTYTEKSFDTVQKNCYLDKIQSMPLLS